MYTLRVRLVYCYVLALLYCYVHTVLHTSTALLLHSIWYCMLRTRYIYTACISTRSSVLHRWLLCIYPHSVRMGTTLCVYGDTDTY